MRSLKIRRSRRKEDLDQSGCLVDDQIKTHQIGDKQKSSEGKFLADKSFTGLGMTDSSQLGKVASKRHAPTRKIAD